MKGVRIRPEHNGIRAVLFDLEADVMEVVWEKGWEEFPIADVHAELEKGRQIAYTTVMTTVVRLWEKELLTRHKDGRRYLYRPLMSREDFVRAMTRDVLDSLPSAGKDEAVALLVERVSEADHDELDRLEALIHRRRQEIDS